MSSLRNHMHVPIHWESCLQGLEIHAATEPGGPRLRVMPTWTTGTVSQDNHDYVASVLR